jgi:hypothetical protein
MTDPSPPPFEVQKWAHGLKREDTQRVFDLVESRRDKMNEAAIKAADSTLRAGLLINGGAGVSVLAFIGSLETKQQIALPQLSRVAGSLEIFAFGVLAAVVGMGFSYLTHLFDADYFGSLKQIGDSPFAEPGPTSKRSLWLRTSAHALAFVAFLFCIGFFIGGMLSQPIAATWLSATVYLALCVWLGPTMAFWLTVITAWTLFWFTLCGRFPVLGVFTSAFLVGFISGLLNYRSGYIYRPRYRRRRR